MMAHLAGRYANGGRLFRWNGRAVPANSNNKWTPEEDKRLLELARSSRGEIGGSLMMTIVS